MKINFWLNGAKKEAEISPDTMLLEFLRSLGCYSVKRGCETANCGLCTVLVNDKPMLSCSVLAARIDGKKVTTMEGLQAEAEEFGTFLANEGAEQCGFCNPGFIMNVLAMTKELAGNLCRCSGFVGQTRSILKYLKYKKNGNIQEKEVQA